MSRSQFKIMHVCFFDLKGMVHYEFIAHGQTANQQCYLEVLTRLGESVGRKRPELWLDKWILHLDNALAHVALRFREFLAKKSITKMNHSPYLTWVSPLRLLALSKIKKIPLRDRCLLTFLTSNAT
jgi:hypothetical protein